MIKAIDHIEIVVSNLDEMSEFLELLGFEKVRETHHHGKSIEYQIPDQKKPLIEIHEAEKEEQPGINHLAFLVEDLEGMTEILRETGASHLSANNEPAESTGRTNTNLRDPDGRRIQLVKDNTR